MYSQGRLLSVGVGAFDKNNTGGLSEWETGLVDNSHLNQDAAMVVISNRPGESPFAGAYQLTVGRVASVATPVATAATVTATVAAGTGTPTPTITPSIVATATAVSTSTPTLAVTATLTSPSDVSAGGAVTGSASPTPVPAPSDR